MIDRVPYGEIDKKAYDRCVKGSRNYRIYATSSYLDATAQYWDVLVYSDYLAVMPLPRRRKYGLSYVYTPGYVQQLGLFSPQEIPEKLENEFYSRLKSSFILADYALHSGSRQSGGFAKRLNYTLDLSLDYETLFDSFNTNRKRILKKGFQELTIEKSQDPDSFFVHLDQQDLGFVPDENSLSAMKRLIQNSPEMVRIWNIYHKNLWVGGLLWLSDHRRITYLLPVTSRKGKELDTPTFILDNLIREHQKTNLLLDLEGSMLPGVAQFYRSFGAQPETYYFLKSRFYGLF